MSSILEYTSATFSSHKVLYAESYETMEELAALIRASKETVLGFDTEMIDTRESPHKYRLTVKGDRFSPTIMVQLATSRFVGLFHLHRDLPSFDDDPVPSGEPLMTLPPGLRQILRSDKMVKVGVATHNDSEGLARTFGLGSVAQLLDLRAYGLMSDLPFNSLSHVARWCGIEGIDKEASHDWCRSLQGDGGHGVSIPDLDYAALDAIVCYEAQRRLTKGRVDAREGARGAKVETDEVE
jgi:hypothetical protein